MIKIRAIGTITLTATLAIGACTSYSKPALADLSNLSAAGRSAAAGMAMPANDYITLPVGGNAVYLRYTAPADGYFFFSTGQNSYVAGNVDDPGGNDLYSFIKYSPNSNGAFAAIFIPVRKGNIVSYGRGNVGGTARFFSAIGALGEA